MKSIKENLRHLIPKASENYRVTGFRPVPFNTKADVDNFHNRITDFTKLTVTTLPSKIHIRSFNLPQQWRQPLNLHHHRKNLPYAIRLIQKSTRRHAIACTKESTREGPLNKTKTNHSSTASNFDNTPKSFSNPTTSRRCKKQSMNTLKPGMNRCSRFSNLLHFITLTHSHSNSSKSSNSNLIFRDEAKPLIFLRWNSKIQRVECVRLS